MGSQDPPTFHRVVPDYAFGSWQSLFFMVWRVHTTLAGAVEGAGLCEAFARARGTKIGLITIIDPDAVRPPADARARLTQFLAEGSYIAASAVTMESTGFRAATVRSITAGLSMLARQPFPHRVFPGVNKTLQWLLPELRSRAGIDLSLAHAALALRQFRDEVDGLAPTHAA